MRENIRGRMPDEARGKRVIVTLANGRLCGVEPVTAVSPPGWAADTTRWTKTGSPWDVASYEVLK